MDNAAGEIDNVSAFGEFGRVSWFDMNLLEEDTRADEQASRNCAKDEQAQKQDEIGVGPLREIERGQRFFKRFGQGHPADDGEDPTGIPMRIFGRHAKISPVAFVEILRKTLRCARRIL
jgi:hypothetical protein